MGCSCRIKWDDASIFRAVNEVVNGLKLQRMPSRNELAAYYGDERLTNAIRRRAGGYYQVAKELNLPMKESDTETGKQAEARVYNILVNMGYRVKRMSQNAPFDLLVNDDIRVDVKFSNTYKLKFYTFRLEKRIPTCDFYFLVANDNINPYRMFIVPAENARQTQISIGMVNSKYNIYENRFDLLRDFKR